VSLVNSKTFRGARIGTFDTVITLVSQKNLNYYDENPNEYIP
jgi:hypothetical protein